MKNTKTKVVAADFKDGVKEIVLREGDAKIIHERKIISLNGVIDSPGNFWDKRKHLHNVDNCHIIFNKIEGRIALVLKESSHFATSISGKMELNPDLVEYGINAGDQIYTTKELQTFLKVRRFHFHDKDACMQIVTNLQKIKASVTQQIEQAKDTRGNETDNFEVKVSSEIKTEFTLEMSIYKGFEKKKFKVEICLDVRERQIDIWLESVELAELIIAEREKIMGDQLKRFDAKIVQIEQ